MVASVAIPWRGKPQIPSPNVLYHRMQKKSSVTILRSLTFFWGKIFRRWPLAAVASRTRKKRALARLDRGETARKQKMPLRLESNLRVCSRRGRCLFSWGLTGIDFFYSCREVKKSVKVSARNIAWSASWFQKKIFPSLSTKKFPAGSEAKGTSDLSDDSSG